MTQLTASLHQTTNPLDATRPVQFGVLVEPAAGTAGVPKIWRGRTIGGGDYAAAEVLFVDTSGNALVWAVTGAWTDRSGTLTTGGTAQQAAAANAARTYLVVENPSATEDLWFNLGATAVAGQPSVLLPPGAAWENPPHFRPTGLVSVIAATTGHAFVVKEA